jgi:hypothetical protein
LPCPGTRPTRQHRPENRPKQGSRRAEHAPHALTLSVLADPTLAAEVERLARTIVDTFAA